MHIALPIATLALTLGLLFFASTTRADAPYREWGREAIASLDRHFRIEGSDHYAEKIGVDQRAISFNWGAGVQLSAFAAAARADPAYRDRLRRYLTAMDEYWYVDANGLGGYNAVARHTGDRYYDDNAWVVLGLVEAYEILGDEKLLKRAEETLNFVLSGEDDKLGGGIYWHEPSRKSKNTCSNGPTATAAVRLWQHTKNPAHLATARRLYDWTRKTFQDSDGLFLDSLNLEGKLDRTKWSYNTALMIRAACLLHEATRERGYLDEARRMAAAAEKQWVKPDTGAIADGGRFAHLLAEAFLDVGRVTGEPRWRARVERAVKFVHDNVDPNGIYGERWDAEVSAPLAQAELIAQSAAARAYWRLASDD